MSNTQTFRVYVACLAAYNNGILHGEWIDITDMQDVDDFHEAINKVLAKSPIPDAEEWAIHDYDGAFPNTDENPDLAALLEWVEFAKECEEEHGLPSEVTKEIWFDGIEDIQDVFAGKADTYLDWVHELVADAGLLDGCTSEIVARYFDYDAYGRDLQLGGDVRVIEHQGDCYIFWNT